MATFAARDLIDFVQKNNARVFYLVDGGARHLFHIDQALLFFLNQIFERLVDFHLPLFGPLAEDVRQHVLQIDVHLFDALIGDDLEGRKITLASFNFDGAVVEFAFSQLLPQFLSRAPGRFSESGIAVDDNSAGVGGNATIGRTRRSWRQKNIEQTFFRVQFGLIRDVLKFFFPNHFNGDLDQIANHGFHIASHVADLGELRSFNFKEWGVRELSQSPGDFGFADAGGPDHQDILRHHLFSHLGREFLPAHTVAQSNSDGALCVFLSDNVLVELGNDFAWGQLVERDLLFFGGSR